MAVVKFCHKKIIVPFDRVHRVRNKCTDENTGNKIHSVIVKFKSWKSHKGFHDARPRNFINSKKKLGLFFNDSGDLT